MAKKFVKADEVSERDQLVAILKEGMPRTFEREPAPAFAEAELLKLADRILAL